MKNDFLTIPDAPKYEINSELIVRIKKSGKFKKQYKRNSGYMFYLFNAGKKVARSPKTLRAQALAAIRSDSCWFPVPSLNYLYEFSRNGCLRNAKSKRVLKMTIRGNYKYFSPSVGGNILNVTVDSLMWEIFGVIPVRPHCARIQVVITKDGLVKKFDSLADCSRFFAAFCFIPFRSAQTYLSNRQTVIDGWQIKYLPSDDWTDEKQKISDSFKRG